MAYSLAEIHSELRQYPFWVKKVYTDTKSSITIVGNHYIIIGYDKSLGGRFMYETEDGSKPSLSGLDPGKRCWEMSYTPKRQISSIEDCFKQKELFRHSRFNYLFLKDLV